MALKQFPLKMNEIYAGNFSRKVEKLHHHEAFFSFQISRDCATGFRANAPQKEKKNDPDIQIERDMSLNFYHAVF